MFYAVGSFVTRSLYLAMVQSAQTGLPIVEHYLKRHS